MEERDDREEGEEGDGEGAHGVVELGLRFDRVMVGMQMGLLRS